MLQQSNISVVLLVAAPIAALDRAAAAGAPVIVGQKNSKGGSDGVAVGDFVLPKIVGLLDGATEGSSVGMGEIVG